MTTLLERIVRDNRLTAADIPLLEEKLFFEGVDRRRQIERFGVLLLLSAIIATYGVLADSTATVIGAMIIAPLMTPIMATAAALVMGNWQRAATALLLVIVGVLGVIGLSWLLAVFYPGVISPSGNLQIVSRSAPTIIDLFIALASGAAGAFAMSRDDVSDSLPGVAIAVALVPPLCVVGSMLAVGERSAAEGAMLLFLTNFLSILLAGGFVLALLGLSKAATRDMTPAAQRTAFITIGIGILLVAAPLSVTTVSVARDALIQQATSTVATEWVADTGYQVREVKSTNEQVYVLIVGHGTPPDPDLLLRAMQAAFRRSVTVDLEIVPSQRQTFVTHAAMQQAVPAETLPAAALTPE